MQRTGVQEASERPYFEVRVLGIWTVVESIKGTREQLRSQMRLWARPFLTLHEKENL